MMCFDNIQFMSQYNNIIIIAMTREFESSSSATQCLWTLLACCLMLRCTQLKLSAFTPPDTFLLYKKEVVRT